MKVPGQGMQKGGEHGQPGQLESLTATPFKDSSALAGHQNCTGKAYFSLKPARHSLCNCLVRPEKSHMVFN